MSQTTEALQAKLEETKISEEKPVTAEQDDQDDQDDDETPVAGGDADKKKKKKLENNKIPTRYRKVAMLIRALLFFHICKDFTKRFIKF